MSYCLRSFRKQYDMEVRIHIAYATITHLHFKPQQVTKLRKTGTFLHKPVHLFLLYLCTEKNTCCTLTMIIESVIILTTKDFPLIYSKKIFRMEDFK